MAATQQVKPGKAGIWIGILLLVLGLGSCVGGPVWAFAGVISSVQDIVDNADKQLTVPADEEYTFENSASGVIVGLGDSQSDAASISVTLTGPDGEVDLSEDDSSFNQTGDVNGTYYSLIGGFSELPDGTYTLKADGDEGAKVAILPLALGDIGLRFLGGIGIGAVLFIIGLILLIVTIVRRSKAKKRLASTGGFTPPPAMGGPGMSPPAPGMAPPPPGGIAPPPAPPGQWGTDATVVQQPSAPPAPPAWSPEAPPAPAWSPEAPPAPAAPPAPPAAPPAPGQWGTDTPPPPPPFGS